MKSINGTKIANVFFDTLNVGTSYLLSTYGIIAFIVGQVAIWLHFPLVISLPIYFVEFVIFMIYIEWLRYSSFNVIEKEIKDSKERDESKSVERKRFDYTMNRTGDNDD